MSSHINKKTHIVYHHQLTLLAVFFNFLNRHAVANINVI